MLVRVSGPLPELLSVSVCAVLATPSVCAGNVSDAGASEAFGRVSCHSGAGQRHGLSRSGIAGVINNV